MARTSLDAVAVAAVTARLSDVERVLPDGRQPVHTCYVPASKVTEDVLRDWGAQALAALDVHGDALAALLPEELAPRIRDRVRAKLVAEPVEDLRIDFEDGYGAPDDAVEDDDAERTAGIVADWHKDGVLPPYVGLRMKSFDTRALRERGIRTLDIFLTALGDPPPGFVITFPKVTSVDQVEVFGDVLDLFGIPLRFEIQVETTQSIVDADGRLAIPRFLEAGRGRVSGLHFGTYDYTAGCGLGAAHQHLAHGACDFARNVMQVSAANAGVRVSDGSTNVLPVGDAVAEGWRTHYGLVRRSLAHGFYQGWDLHPAQLVTRYAAVHAFYLEGVEADARRLKAYVDRAGGTASDGASAGKITSAASDGASAGKITSALLDEPATAQALSSSFLRALDCGALDEAEVLRVTGLRVEDLGALASRTA